MASRTGTTVPALKRPASTPDPSDDDGGRPPSGRKKKTLGRLKIEMKYIDEKQKRMICFSKRKAGLMKKAYELSALTGTEVMLLVASETGHVYTFATKKLQPMITSDAGKTLIQTCLNTPDEDEMNNVRANGVRKEEQEAVDRDEDDDDYPGRLTGESDEDSEAEWKYSAPESGVERDVDLGSESQTSIDMSPTPSSSSGSSQQQVVLIPMLLPAPVISRPKKFHLAGDS